MICEIMKTRKRGEPFYPGYQIKSLTVLDVRSEADRVCDWVYLVKNAKCGHEIEMRHKMVLQRRAQPHSGLCVTCARIKAGKDLAKRRVWLQEKKKAIPAEYNVAWAHKLWPTATGTPRVW